MKGANSAEAGRSGRGRVLTWRQRKVFQVIKDYVEANGCSPTSREIAEAAGLKSASTVHHHLKQLKAAGWVTYQAGSPRTVRVLRPSKGAAQPDEEPGETPGDAGRAPGDMDPQKVV